MTTCALCQATTPEHDLVYSEHGQICASCELDQVPASPIWKHPALALGGGAIVVTFALTINLNGFQPVPLVGGAVAVIAGVWALASKDTFYDKKQRMGLGALILVLGLWRLAAGAMSLM